MSELNNLQQLWKGQPTDQELPDPEQTLSGIKQLHQKVHRERIGLTISFLLTFLVLIGTFWLYQDTFYIVGILIIMVAMAFMLFLFWKNQQTAAGERFELSNEQFLSANITFMTKRRSFTSRYMPIYAFGLILGMNIAYLSLLREMDLEIPIRIGIHLGLILIMVVLFYVGIKRHLKKFDRRVAPLLTRLKKIQALEEAE